MELQKVFTDPRSVTLPLPTLSHPDWKGRTLGEILEENPEEGQRLLDFLANGYKGPFHLKLAAALILAESRKWGPFARAQRARKTTGKKKAEHPVGLTKGLLQAAVGVAARFTAKPKGNTIPALEHILVVQDVNGLTLQATDLESGVVVRVPHLKREPPMAGLVPKKALAAAVKAPRAAIKREPVELEWLDRTATLKIKTPQGDMMLLGMDPVEAPPVPIAPADAPRCTVPTSLLAVAAVAAAGDDARPVLTGVFVGRQEGKSYIAAADGYRMFYTSDLDLPDKFPDTALIPKKAVEKAATVFTGDVAIAVDLSREDLRRATITGQAKDKTLAQAGAEVSVVTTLIDGLFPDIERTIGSTFDLPPTLQVASQAVLDALGSLRATLNGADMIYLVVQDGVLALIAKSAEYGNQTIKIPVQYTGEPTFVACNIRYLEEAVKTIQSLGIEEAVLRVRPLDEKDRPPAKPIGISDPDDRFRWAFMPMHPGDLNPY